MESFVFIIDNNMDSIDPIGTVEVVFSINFVFIVNVVDIMDNNRGF
jgi:hypothetical protein